MGVLYDVAEAFYRFMMSGPPFPVQLLYFALLAIPVTLVHELGHAFAASRLLGEKVEVTVGSVGKLVELRLGAITASISAVSALGGPGGTASFDDSRATARDILVVALAGPLASLGGLVLAGTLLARTAGSGFIHDVLWAAAFVGAFGVLNLVPLKLEERSGGPQWRSDGWLAVDALRTIWALR